MSISERQIQKIAQDWKARSSYYNKAERESWIRGFWHSEGHFRPLFEKLDKSRLLELACGHGRHTAQILGTPELRKDIVSILLMDVNEENISFCRQRFAPSDIVSFRVNNGYDFRPSENETITGIFCYDAMVHFEFDAIISYLQDTFRILTSGGRALFHHSNYDLRPGADYQQNPEWRNFMNKRFFAHIANRAGLKVMEQVVIDWGSARELDCISLVEKPKSMNVEATRGSRLFGQIRGIFG